MSRSSFVPILAVLLVVGCARAADPANPSTGDDTSPVDTAASSTDTSPTEPDVAPGDALVWLCIDGIV